MTSQSVMKRYLTSVAKNNEEYKDNKSMQTLASLIANYKKLDAEDKEVLDAKIESAYNKLQSKGVSASKSTPKATTTRKPKSSSDGGLKGILADLKKKLGAQKFKEATTGTDIRKDIQIPALKKGKRIVRKKGYTSNFYGRFKNKVGSTYYENRANRYDANQPSQTRKYKLADGGNTKGVKYLKSDGVSQSSVSNKNEATPMWITEAEYYISSNPKNYFRAIAEKIDKSLPDRVGKNYIIKIVPKQLKKSTMAKGGEIEVGSIVNLPEIKMKDGRVQYERVVGGEVIGIEDGIYDVLNPKTNRLHRVTKEQIEQIDQAKAKHNRSRASLRSNEDTYPKGTEFAKGGEVGKIDYNEVLPILKEKLEDAVENLIPREYEYSSEYKGEEVESKSRDGFIAFTDGGYEVTWFEFVSMFNGSGYSLPTKALDDELQRQVDYNYQLAKERFMEEYPEIYEELGFDVDYNSLYEAGYEAEAEQLSEWESDYDGEGTIMCSVGAYYYEPDNSRSKDGKHTIRLFGVVNLESPYHRRGNLEDSIDIDITFDSIAEMEEKLDYEISEICSGWFNGANYNESTEKLKIVRMAKGGKLSNRAKYIPKRDIAEIEVEKNGKSKSIDGANLLDGVYVKKGTKFAKGGEVGEKIFEAKENGILGIFSGSDAYSIEISKGDFFKTFGEQDNPNWWYVKKIDKKTSTMSEIDNWDYTKSKSRINVDWNDLVLTFPREDKMMYAEMREINAKGGTTKRMSRKSC